MPGGSATGASRHRLGIAWQRGAPISDPACFQTIPPDRPGRRPALRGLCQPVPFGNPFGILCAAIHPNPHAPRGFPGAGVAQIFNLLYRGFATRGTAAEAGALERPNALPIADRRHSRVQLCATWVAASLRCALLALVAGWLAGTSAARAQEPRASEYQLKAAFLINFPKYADWPAESFAETNTPVVITVLGETKLTGEIEKAIAGRTVNGREIVLKHLPSGADAGSCHLLFVPAAELQRSPNLLAQLKATGILTVGESDDFLERGGIINLARRDQKIALEVNLTAAEKARIKISSKLLGVATVVKGRPK
jgi:hypothetical protein